MISFLKFRSKRHGYDGWALRFGKTGLPMPWTVCTTRGEVRSLRASRTDLFLEETQVVKVKIHLEVVGCVVDR